MRAGTRPWVPAMPASWCGTSCRTWSSPIIVATTLSVGKIILLESVLSFLALGIQPPIPSWGNMLTNAQELIWSAPNLVFYPGLLIFMTVIAFNFLGDGLQDALDPRAMTNRR